MLKHLQSVILDEPIENGKTMVDAQKLMDLVMHTQGIGNWRVDVRSGQAWWSPRVFEIHGMEPTDGPVDVEAGIRAYHAEDARTVAWLVMNAIENKVGFTFVLRLNRADGEVRLVESAATVDVDENGEVTTLYGIFKDVTSRFTERDVAEGRGRLVRSIISHSPAPLVVLDRQMRYLEISPAWVDFYGLPEAKHLVGKFHNDVMPNQTEEFRRYSEQALAGETVHSRVSFKDSKTGQTLDRGAALFPWKSSNEEVGGIIIMLTPPDRVHEQDTTLNEIANLFRQMGGAAPDWMTRSQRPTRVRGGSRW